MSRNRNRGDHWVALRPITGLLLIFTKGLDAVRFKYLSDVRLSETLVGAA